MRTVFFGTPQWAVPSLASLLASSIEVAAVVTNPDRPAGRGMTERASPVKLAATEAGVELLQPSGGRDPALAARLRELAPDVATVVAYGHILPGALLEIPRLGFVNLHFSLLPKLRGAAPVQRAVMEGSPATGVSLMVLDEGMDEGPVLAAEAVAVDPEETAGALGARLAELGAELLVRSLPGYADGSLRPQEQDHEVATYAPKISPEEARIEWTRSSTGIRNLVRGLNPTPGAWTTFRAVRMKVLEVGSGEGDGGLAPGEPAADRGLAVGTGDGRLELCVVQPAGKLPMTGAEWARGARLEPGDRLGR
ncbi:MAG: methionyl-tRNA formyltransferase [Actinomycetota bacterium]